METSTVKSYLYQQYETDLDLQAFVGAYNTLTQQYVDWCNSINLPIYTGLSGSMLDWVGAGLYGYPRPTIGTPSGAIYNSAIYNQVKYGTAAIGSITVTDDIYKRILTWKTHRGDGLYMDINWLKRRLKRFLVGINGTSPAIDNTYEISVYSSVADRINIVITNPANPEIATILGQCLQSGALDMPWQYSLSVTIL